MNLIGAVERDEVDAVIARDVHRVTRNLADWDRFEKAAIEHRIPALRGNRGRCPCR